MPLLFSRAYVMLSRCLASSSCPRVESREYPRLGCQIPAGMRANSTITELLAQSFNCIYQIWLRHHTANSCKKTSCVGGVYEFATQYMDRSTVYGLCLECDNGGLLAHDHRCSICRKDARLVRWMDNLTMMMQVISCSLAWAIHGVKIVLPGSMMPDVWWGPTSCADCSCFRMNTVLCML